MRRSARVLPLVLAAACRSDGGGAATAPSASSDGSDGGESTIGSGATAATGDGADTSHTPDSGAGPGDTATGDGSSAGDDGNDTGTPVGCGADDPCDGATRWNRRFGAVVFSDGHEEVDAIAAMPDGGAVIVGRIDEFAEFDGEGTISGPAGFMARLDPEGTVAWVREIHSDANLLFDDVVADGDGNIVMSGGTYGDLDLGTQIVAGDDLGWGPFVVGFDAQGGDRFAIRPAGAYGTTQLAVGPAGAFGLVASLPGTVELAGTTLTSTAGSEDFLAAVFEHDGSLRWARAYGGDDLERGSGAAFDDAGDFYCAGSSIGPVDFGLDPLPDLGGLTLTIAKLAGADGTPQWARQFGTSLGAPHLASDGARVYVATVDSGYVTAVDFGTGVVEGYYFVAAFDPDGATRWARGFGSDYTLGGAPAIAAAGTDVVVALHVEDGVDLGDGTLASSTGTFAAKYAGSDGALLWARTATGSGYQAIYDVAGLPDGRAFVGGYIGDTLDFGLGDLGPMGPGTAVGNDDGLVVALMP